MVGESVHEWHTETAVQSYAELEPNGNLVYPTRDRSVIAGSGLRELTPRASGTSSTCSRAPTAQQSSQGDR